MQSYEKHGFTLVELLVVIAIISILAAMLLPVLQKARDSAIAAACTSNLKQQGVAFFEYVQDSQGLFPNPWGVEGADGADTYGREREYPWPPLLNQYVAAPIGTWTTYSGMKYIGLAATNTSNIYTCPQGRPGYGLFGLSFNWRGGGSYTMSYHLFHMMLPDGTYYGGSWSTMVGKGWLRESRVKNPSHKIAILDGYVNYNMWTAGTYTWPAYRPAWVDGTGDTTQPNPYGRSNYRWPYHLGQGNHLFLDGHVQGLRSEWCWQERERDYWAMVW